MMDAIPFLSVCSGIGAPEVAWSPHGMESCLASEIEAFPRAVLAYRFGAEDAAGTRIGTGPALWGDFTALRVRHLRRLGVALPRSLVGGTPCQSFSIAGKRGSLDDPRGNLSLSYVRLAHALANALAGRQRLVDDDGPVFYAVWENVPGVLSTKDNAFGCFLGAIVGGDAPLVPPGAEWGAMPAFDPRSHDVHRTYGWKSCRWPDEGMVEGPWARAAWRVLDAQHFRVPQRRRRVFVVVGFGAGADPAEVLLELECLPGDFEAGGSEGEGVAPTLAGGARSRGGYSHDDIPLVGEAYGGGNASGSIDVAACLTAKGQRIDFEVETFVAHTLRARHNSAHDASKETYVAHTLRGEGFDVSEDGSGRGIPLVPAYIADIASTLTAGANTSGGDRQPGMGAETAAGYLVAFNARQDTEVYGDVAGTLDVGSPQGQAIAFDTTQITSAANRSHPQPGDPCHPLAAGAHPPAIAFSSKDHGADAGEIAPTLRAMNHAGSHANAGGQVAIATSQFGVRRLMPTECARLQSFPDDHACIPWRGAAAEDCPDGPQYRAYGNSMNVKVMSWLGARLAASIRRADA